MPTPTEVATFDVAPTRTRVALRHGMRLVGETVEMCLLSSDGTRFVRATWTDDRPSLWAVPGTPGMACIAHGQPPTDEAEWSDIGGLYQIVYRRSPGDALYVHPFREPYPTVAVRRGLAVIVNVSINADHQFLE